MKKQAIVLSMIMGAMIVGLSGCGGNKSADSSKDKVSSSKVAKSKVKKSKAAKTESSASATSSSTSEPQVALSTLVPAANQQAQNLKTNAGDTYHTIEVKQQGENTLIYQFTLNQSLGDVDKASLKAALMTGVAGSLKQVYQARPGTRTMLLLLNPDQSIVLNTEVTEKDLNGMQGQQ